MPNCTVHQSCDLSCSVCGAYYSFLCRTDFHETVFGTHRRRPDPHSDLDTIDLDHDLGMRDLPDPVTGRLW
jgi:hypothetical protein